MITFPYTSAMSRRYIAAAILASAVAGLSTTASAQLGGYDRTMFLHGFNSGPGAWTSGNTPNRLAQTIYLGARPYVTPQTDGTNTVNVQRDQIRGLLNANADREVLIGHSMGGLVARAVYINSPADVAGIVTVASPHEGTYIANNLSLAIAFFADVQRRADDGYQASNSLFIGLPELVSGIEHVTFVDLRQAGIGTDEPAIGDLRTDSPEIGYLDQYTQDGVPHANVFGTIPHRDAIIRVGLSALGRDAEFEGFEGDRDKLKSLLKAILFS